MKGLGVSPGIECTRVGMGKEVETISGDAMFREVQRVRTLEIEILLKPWCHWLLLVVEAEARIVVATCIGSGMEVLTRGKLLAVLLVVLLAHIRVLNCQTQ